MESYHYPTKNYYMYYDSCVFIIIIVLIFNISCSETTLIKQCGNIATTDKTVQN